MKKTIWIIVAVVVIGGVVWVGSHKPASNSPVGELKIGTALPMTGVYASFGEEFQRGAKLAEEEINRNGGNIKVFVEDTALEAKKAADAVNKLVNSDGVDAVIVSAYLEAAASHQMSDQKNIPMIVLWDSNPQIEAMGDKVFAIGPWTPASGEVTAKFMYDQGARKAGVFADKQEWAVAVSDAFTKTFDNLGGKVSASEFVSPGTKDYKAQLSKLITTKPDVLYLTAEDLLVAIKQSRDLGFKGYIMTSDLLDNDQIEQQPALFEGVYSSQVADPVASKTAHYVELYKKKYGSEPKKLLYGTWGYDGVGIIYTASQSARSSSLSESLYQLPTFMGASGDIKFDSKGTSKTVPKMFVVKKGVITLIK